MQVEKPELSSEAQMELLTEFWCCAAGDNQTYDEYGNYDRYHALIFHADAPPFIVHQFG